MTYSSRAGALPASMVAAALIAAFFSSLAVSRAAPSVFEVLFGTLPSFVLGGVLVLAACRALGVAREEAEARTVQVLVAAAGVAALASCLGAWDNLGAILLPRQAFFSILTLRVWPFGEGPLAAIRFLPVAFATGAFVVARRSGVDELRAAATAFGIYALQAAVTHALSWLVWAEYLQAHDILENVQDAYRIFVSANVNGYWTDSQAERFFAAAGGQAETAMQALHGALTYTLAILVTAVAWAPWKRPMAAWRDLFGPDALRQAAILAFGAAIGWSVRSGGPSFSGLLALVLFLGAGLGWLVAGDEGGEGEDRYFGRALAIGCAFLLGWPVAVGLIVAGLARRGLVRGQAWSGIWPMAAGSLLSGLALAWAGLAFGLHDLPSSAWMLRALLAAAMLGAGSWLGSKLLRSALAPQWQVGYVLGVAAFSVLISAQIYFIIPFALFTCAVVVLRRVEASWAICKTWLLDAFLASLVFLVLAAPALLGH